MTVYLLPATTLEPVRLPTAASMALSTVVSGA